MDTQDRTAAIAEMQAILLSATGIDDVVQAVADAAAERLAPQAEVTVTLRREGRLRTVASSGARARRCDEAEYETDAGPCVQAVEEGGSVLVHDIAHDDRWPHWARCAAQVGFRSAAAFSAVAEPGVSVSVNVYSDAHDEWLASAADHGGLYAAEVARAVQLSLRVERAVETSRDLRSALDSRTVIDQAIGVIMGQNRCSAEEAFAILRSASQHRNVKLRDVASSVIENVTGSAPSPSHAFVERST